MRTIHFGAICCVLSALIILSCSSQQEDSSSNGGGTKGVALGELTVDRCLFYIEGENFTKKSGGGPDFKGGAFGKKCLGDRWGEKPTDYVTYDINNYEETTESSLLVIRAAFENSNRQTYEVVLDDKTVKYTTLEPTGGYGYTEKEWNCFSIPLGRIEKGRHSLTIRPSGKSGIVNIDCLALGKAG
jgi:hypothetical protein